ncbi:pimeloyl-ACP methyl ester carboxylesterase [Kineosphaera limosa]|uniref:AB hydrolase-1 domain-containing protein n=1 Tax=Kineosphaera limosa NBRC 100340 TaxID=1184609 RepID=K6X7F8_9MICO|nr:alpha/beta hydrolase [Kineosphaera limosa]NYD98930.1 pimeloyl-ACP methyl ester carboxylesterase [Kineosphaera limosa]GAB94744.1 hypothetical protein KILIM_011_00170 [Kineosphaera limosa NBRC 100340]
MTSASAAPQFTIAVEGGDLTVHDLSGPEAGADAPLVVLVHGITANGLSWGSTAAALADDPATSRCRVWAPDLRGRAGSRGVGSDGDQYGLAAHVADLVALADHAQVERFVLVGHSMGGFIGALAAVTIPARLHGVVLVDGGPAFPPPPDLDIDAALQAVIGPAMARLSMTFADDGAYLDFWRQHPAVAPLLAGPHADAVTAYLLHDLIDAPDGSGQKVSSCVVDAIRADGRDVLADERTHVGVRVAAEAGVPIEFIWAQRGLLNEDQGLYDEQRIAALQLPAQVSVTAVRDVNHYSVIFDPAGTTIIRDAVARILR